MDLTFKNKLNSIGHIRNYKMVSIFNLVGEHRSYDPLPSLYRHLNRYAVEHIFKEVGIDYKNA